MSTLKTYRQRVINGEIDDPDFLKPDQTTLRIDKASHIIAFICVILLVSGIIIVYFTPIGRIVWK